MRFVSLPDGMFFGLHIRAYWIARRRAKLTNISFGYVETEKSTRELAIDPGGTVMVTSVWLTGAGKIMSCTNCECPFYVLHTENGPMSSAELNCLVTDAVKQVNFSAGDVLFAQGQNSASLFSLSDGVVKITCNSSDGREQIVGLSIPGKLLVGLQSIDQELYEYTAVAASDGKACKIRHRALLSELKDKPEIALRLIGALNAQLAHSRALMQVMGHKTAVAKIASFILLVTPEVQQVESNFTLPFSRNDIAGLLGLTEETVCRQMADLKRHNVIYAPRGKMRVQDWGQLRAIADGRSV